MRIASATLLALLLALVPTASAAGVRVPPGNGAATQYSETVPGAGGEEGAPEVARGGSPSTGSTGGQAKAAVPAATTAELEALGPEGEAALNLAEAGASGHRKSSAHKDGGAPAGSGNSGTPGGPGAEGGGSSGLGTVFGAAVGTSGGGLGFLQPLILAAVFLGACAYLLGRRRKGHAVPPERSRG